MDTHDMIADLAVGQRVAGYYILQEPQIRQSSTGKPFLSAALADRSGTIAAKAWDYSGPAQESDSGRIVWVSGTAGEYRGTPQFTIDKLRFAAESERVDLRDLVPAAPIDASAARERVLETVRSIEDGDYRRVCEEMLARHGQAFFSMPAAKSVHHAFLNGLLMHTANMLALAERVAALYPDVVDRSLLLAGTLLHDFGKEREFTLTPLGLAADYSVAGQLMGHLVMCAEEVGALAGELGVPEEKSALLRHLILSHHGQPEFGAAVRPACAEAELLSLIDMIDSRAEIYRETLAQTPPGEFSARVFALENRRVYNHFAD